MTAGILDLPVEIVQYIHLLAQNPFLPLVHPIIHDSLSHLPSRYVAQYLLSLYEPYGPSEILVRAIRHPICTVAVVQEIHRRWDRHRGYVQPSATTHSRQEDHYADSDDEVTSPPSPTAPPLRCPELPRRLFRSPPDPAQPIHPLIKHLFDTYTPSSNSHKGYPLCRAVLTKNRPLISYLISHGADPAVKDSLAVQIAISMNDLDIVKLLVERTPEEAAERARTGGKKRKKRRLSDRVEVGSELVQYAMKKGARDIIHYFVQEKGVMPPLQSIMKLGHDSPVTRQKAVRKEALSRAKRIAT